MSNRFQLTHKEEAMCKHCGKLEPYEPVFDDGHKLYCMNCAHYEQSFLDTFTIEEIDAATATSYRKQIKYYEEQVLLRERWLRQLEKRFI